MSLGKIIFLVILTANVVLSIFHYIGDNFAQSACHIALVILLIQTDTKLND